MNVFIVFAHHDPNSLAFSMKERAVQVLQRQGHAVVVSDLHSMKFKAVADDGDFDTPRPNGASALTNYQARQKAAVADGSFSQDILAEQAKLDWADAVIFVFPYYFFNMPAILKGFLERVIVYGMHYDFDHPSLGSYGTGGLRGKRALIAMTSGAPAPVAELGASRHHERIEAMQNGSLNYCGFDVMRPFVAWGVPWVGPDRLTSYMEEWEARLGSLFVEPPELPAALGPTPAPERLVGRVRAPGDHVWPYGGDKAMAQEVTLVRLTARAGLLDALIDRLRPYVKAASNEVGTRVYSVLRAPGKPDEAWMIEAHESAEARSRHQDADPFRNIRADVEGLLATPPEVITLLPEISKGI